MLDIFNYTLKELAEHLSEKGFKSFAANQIYDWIYKKYIYKFDEMLNLSKDLRKYLIENFVLEPLNCLTTEHSHDGTIKQLNLLSDNKTIETVLMPQLYGQSICVTTQVGCKMACTFCASGLIKTERSLTTGEIVNQVYSMNLELQKKYKNDMKNPKARVSHIVIMGIGEPFDNFDNVIRFIKIMNDPKGLDIGARHITVSTCGVVPKIIEFANLELQVNLAISLHAPNNEVRNQIMPINKAYPIEKLIESIKYYIEKTNKRVTIEYILIDSINDSVENAHQLGKLLNKMNCYVNLIPYNEVEENPYKKSKNIDEFSKVLHIYKSQVIVRKEFGADINAACGQLRAKREGVIKNEV